MTGTVRGMGLLAAGMLLASCGNSGGGDAAEDTPPSATSSAPSPSPTPRNVESEVCRDSMGTADAIAVEMETGAVAAREFTKLFDRLSVLRKRVERDCSADVHRPLAKALYQLSKANLWYTLCDIGSPCGDSRAERYLLKGTSLIHRAQTIASETSG